MMGHNISIAEAREVLGLDVDPTHIPAKDMETMEIGEMKV
jgi:hypothetical protein